MESDETPNTEFVKYPKIPFLEEDKSILNKPIFLFEKIDGAQSQIRNMPQGIIGGSKSNFLTGKRLGFSSWFQKFNKWLRSNKSLENLPDDVIMFGEWLDPTTIDYDKENINKFYFFDLAHIQNNRPVLFNYEEAVSYLKDWGIKDVIIMPPIKKGLFTFKQIKDMRENAKSSLYRGNLEGLVLKNYATQSIAKTLNPEYSDLREQEKTLENKYINLPRVRKAVQRIREDQGFNAPSFDRVAQRVSDDVRSESGITFDPRAVKAVMRIGDLYPTNLSEFSDYRDSKVEVNLPDYQTVLGTKLTRRTVRKAKNVLVRQYHIEHPSGHRLALEVGKALFPQGDFDTERIYDAMKKKKLFHQ